MPDERSPGVLRGVWAWSQERFPASQGLAISVLFATGLGYGRFLTTQSPLSMGLADGVGLLACWSMFLLLRVADEHKDFERDRLTHPERVLSRGLVGLAQLRVLAVLAIALQAVHTLAGHGLVSKVSLAWLLTLAWTGLMRVEFFAPRWLSARLPLYGITHLLVMPLILTWVACMGADERALGAGMGWLAALALFAGGTYELTRKAWGADEEREEVDSYSRVFGARGVSAAIGAVFGLATLASIGMLASILGTWSAWMLAPAAAWLALALCVRRYAAEPTAPARIRNEAVAGLGMVVVYATPLAAMICERGLSWS